MTLDEKNGFDKLDRIKEAQKYLDETDYAITKISEATALGEDITALKEKYADVIAKRKEARTLIDSLR